MATGAGSVAVCQPDAVSPEKFADDSMVPVAVHSMPTWVPVFAAPL